MQREGEMKILEKFSMKSHPVEKFQICSPIKHEGNFVIDRNILPYIDNIETIDLAQLINTCIRPYSHNIYAYE